MHKIRLVVGILLVAVLILNSTACESPEIEPARYLVLISIDGCRPDYLEIVDIPNIEGLMKTGVCYQNAWVGQLLNNTPPGHTTMSTGVFPKNNGVLGFNWWDPKRGTMYSPTGWTAVTSGGFTAVVTDSGASSIGSLYKKTNPEAKVAALSSTKHHAAAGLGSVGADFILFTSRGQGPARPAGVEGHLASDEIMNDRELEKELVELGDGDTWAMDLALKLVEKERPEILLINLPDTDEAGHKAGGIINPDVMRKVISNVDKQIGRLIETYKEAGIFNDTLFVITADHGMTPNMRNLRDAAVDDVVTKAGTNRLSHGSTIWLEDPTQAAEIAEDIAHDEIPAVLGTFYKKVVDGNFSYVASPTSQQRLTPDLENCFRYLMSTFASDKSPDVKLVLNENCQFGMYPLASHGKHDEISWSTQHIPLVISGPGVKQGVILDTPARLVDIAPTVLDRMGIEPQNMDGIVLADALRSPTKEQVDAQKQIIRNLTPMQEALMARSEVDLEGGYDQPAVEGPWQTAGSYKIVMVVAPKDFNKKEYLEIRRNFESIGSHVMVASTTLDEAIAMRGLLKVNPDITISQITDQNPDAIVLIGGRGSVKYLWNNRGLQQVLTDLHSQGKVVAAISLSPVILARAGLLENKPATVRLDQEAIDELKLGGAKYRDRAVVVKGRIVTGRDPKAAPQFAKAILDQVSLVR